MTAPAPALTLAEEQLIRRYAAGKLPWSSLRNMGFESYLDVLGALGELGLTPPRAPLEGQEDAMEIIRQAAMANAPAT